MCAVLCSNFVLSSQPSDGLTTRRNQVPGFHRPVAMRAGSRTGQTPCLVTASGSCVDNSDDILRWLDTQAAAAARARLYPSHFEPQVTDLCKRFDTTLGESARVWAYFHLLDTAPLQDAMCAIGLCPSYERTAFYLGAGFLLRMAMRAGLNLTRDHMLSSVERIRQEFEAAKDLLADGRAYLCGNELTAADITFIALAAPVLGIPYGPAPPFPDGRYPSDEAMSVVAELSATPAGVWAHRVWKTERQRVLPA